MKPRMILRAKLVLFYHLAQSNKGDYKMKTPVTPKHANIVWPEFMEDAKRFQEMSMAIVNQRQGEIYDDNWAIMSLSSIIEAAKYKCDRADYTANPLKKLDDVLDAYNYCRYAGVRLLADIASLKEAPTEVLKRQLNFQPSTVLMDPTPVRVDWKAIPAYDEKYMFMELEGIISFYLNNECYAHAERIGKILYTMGYRPSFTDVQVLFEEIQRDIEDAVDTNNSPGK